MRLSHLFLPTLLPSFLCFASSYALAAEQHAPDAAQANNPLANMTAFNMQNYYIGDISGTDQDANSSGSGMHNLLLWVKATGC